MLPEARAVEDKAKPAGQGTRRNDEKEQRAERRLCSRKVAALKLPAGADAAASGGKYDEAITNFTKPQNWDANVQLSQRGEDGRSFTLGNSLLCTFGC